MNEQYKIVFYHLYCDSCKYSELDDHKEPCNECLTHPTNLYSHKPINYDGPKDAVEEHKEVAV